jgi:hypothetical protein
MSKRGKAREGLKVSTRIGLVAYGFLHLLVAWVAVELAFGARHQDSSGQGALRQLASEPLGKVLVWAIAVGMLGFSVRRAVEGCIGHRDEDGSERWRHRARAWTKAVVYAVVGASAVRTVTSGSSGSRSERTLSAQVMDLPGGRWLVVLVGAVIVGVGLHHAYRGLSRDFRDELSAGGRRGEAGTVYLTFGQVGYTAKGVVFVLVGILVAYAGITHDPQKSRGLDSALQTVRDQPFGPALLVAVAAGIACYGLFCFAQARHLSR